MIRARLRTFTLRTGALLCVLIAVAFVVSARWQIVLQFPTSRGPALILMAGSVRLVNDVWAFVPATTDSHSYGLSRWNSWVAFRVTTLLTLGGPVRRVSHLEFPIYAMFLAVAAPTLLVWRFGRKPVKPGHCECGYDLRGNVSGTCPECGRETTGPATGTTR